MGHTTGSAQGPMRVARPERPLALVDRLRAVREAWRADRALRSALRSFERRHPRWYASCFDGALLERRDAGAAVRARDARGLARAWTQRFRYADERRRERDVAVVTEVAEAFLGLLEEAERAHGVGGTAARRSGALG